MTSNHRKDETGNTYERLTVIAFSHTNNRYAHWKCKCICGNVVVVNGRDLRRGHSKSCGCLHNEGDHKTHGMSKKTGFYNVWCGMRKRDYKYKVKVCERWRTFELFKEDMYDSYLEHKSKHKYTSIDRIDNEKGYSPDNCRWATHDVQQNNKSTNIYVYVDGEKMSLRKACSKLNLRYGTVYARIKAYGWSIERALS